MDELLKKLHQQASSASSSLPKDFIFQTLCYYYLPRMWRNSGQSPNFGMLFSMIPSSSCCSPINNNKSSCHLSSLHLNPWTLKNSTIQLSKTSNIHHLSQIVSRLCNFWDFSQGKPIYFVDLVLISLATTTRL